MKNLCLFVYLSFIGGFAKLTFINFFIKWHRGLSQGCSLCPWMYSFIEWFLITIVLLIIIYLKRLSYIIYLLILVFLHLPHDLSIIIWKGRRSWIVWFCIGALDINLIIFLYPHWMCKFLRLLIMHFILFI